MLFRSNDVGSGLFHIKCKAFTVEAASINLVTPGGVISLSSLLSILAPSVSVTSVGNVSVSGAQIHLNDLGV